MFYASLPSPSPESRAKVSSDVEEVAWQWRSCLCWVREVYGKHSIMCSECKLNVIVELNEWRILLLLFCIVHANCLRHSAAYFVASSSGDFQSRNFHENEWVFFVVFLEKWMEWSNSNFSNFYNVTTTKTKFTAQRPIICPHWPTCFQLAAAMLLRTKVFYHA